MYKLARFICNLFTSLGITGIISVFICNFAPDNFLLGFVGKNYVEVFTVSLVFIIIGYMAFVIASNASEN